MLDNKTARYTPAVARIVQRHLVLAVVVLVVHSLASSSPLIVLGRSPIIFLNVLQEKNQ